MCVRVHPTDFCAWKMEACWDEGYFTRAKTYIEHVTHEDGEPVAPWYNVKCAGMPDHCKALFMMSMEGEVPEGAKVTDEERRWVMEKRRTYEDFDVGLTVPGKLAAKLIPGGTVLVEMPYTMHAGVWVR